MITTPKSNSFQVLNLNTNEFTRIETDIWNARGPGAVVAANARAYIANQMTASITVVDLNANTVMNTFRVDPGPRALDVDPARNRLLVALAWNGSSQCRRPGKLHDRRAGRRDQRRPGWTLDAAHNHFGHAKLSAARHDLHHDHHRRQPAGGGGSRVSGHGAGNGPGTDGQHGARR